MNLALSDEQVFLREAARGALSRFKTLEAAREALDGDEQALPDLWPTACEAGWPGLLIDEEHGGAGPRRLRRDARARRVRPRDRGRAAARATCRRRRSSTRRPATTPMLDELATGEQARRLPARSALPATSSTGWTVDPRSGIERGAAPARAARGGA